MVNNQIRVFLAKRGLSAKALADQMPDDCNAAVMSYIMNGKAMPTRDTLDRMCAVLDCEPTDLYTIDDLDLLSRDGIQGDIGVTASEEVFKRFSEEITEVIRRFFGSSVVEIKLPEVILHESGAD